MSDLPLIIQAHQYLYYVLGQPVISDGEYDELCKKHGVSGTGGSDSANDYSNEAKTIANKLSS